MRISSSAAIFLGAWLAAVPAAQAQADDPLRDAAVRRVRDAFRIENLALLDIPIPGPVRGAACTPNAANGITWCATGTSYQTTDSGAFSKSFGYNLDTKGRVVHIVLTRNEYPLERAKFDDTLKTMGARYGGVPVTITFQGKTVEGDDVASLIAVWGPIKLVRLSDAELRVVAAGGAIGRTPLIDHRQNPRNSAQQRDPVFKVEGAAGYIVQLRSVTDVRTDIVQRVVYPAGFADAAPGTKPAEPAARVFPLDPALALHADKARAEEERLAAIERARRAEEERKAAEERRIAEERRRAEEERIRAEAERKAAEERRLAEERARVEAERKAAEERTAAEERRIADEAARAEAARKAAEERKIAEERARREEVERKAAEERRRIDAERKAAEDRRQAEERARRAEAERKAAEERRLAEERARAEAERKAAEERRLAEERTRAEAERKAAEERRAMEERARKAEADYKSAVERARKAEIERLAAEDRVRKAEAERKVAEDRTKKLEAERKLADERARREEGERKAAEDRRLQAERKAAEEKKAEEARRIAAERARLEDETRRAAQEKARRDEGQRKSDAAQAEEERRAAEDRARRAEAERAAAERQRAEAERRADEARRGADERPAAATRPTAPDRPAAPERKVADAPETSKSDAGTGLTREAWLRMAAARAKSGGVHWVFNRVRDRISDDLVLQAQAVFAGGDRLAVEIAFECNVDAGKRLKAYVRAFDARTKASLRIPPEDGQASVVRGGVALDEGAPQTAFLFPERDGRQASIVEVPVTSEDIRKNTPRAQAWLRHYQIAIKIRLAQGEAVANIHPYDDNLRRVLDGCVP